MRTLLGAIAALVAVSAHAADVHIGINVGVPLPPPPPPIVVETPPPLVVVPGTPVYYAPALPYNFFYYDGLYYVSHGDYWYASQSAHGPWQFARRVPPPVLRVPARYYRVPPGHAKHWDGEHHGHGHEHGHGRGHGHGHDDD